jgi:hypothetical protein
MPALPIRLLTGFLAGFLSHLTVEAAVGAGLHAAGLLPALPWSLTPVGPLGVPQTMSLGFWAGLFGVAYALLEPQLTARFGRRGGGLLYGLAVPLLTDWFVVLPLKGHGVGGGFSPAAIPVDVALNATLGVGAAALFWAGLALARRRPPAAPEPLRG